MSWRSPRRLAVLVVERQTRSLRLRDVQSRPQTAVRTIEAESGLASLTQRHRGPQSAGLVEQINSRRTVCIDIHSQPGATIRVVMVEAYRAVARHTYRAAKFASAVAQQKLLRLQGIRNP